MRRLRPVLALPLLFLALVPASAQAAEYRSCSGSDRATGIASVRVLRVTCTQGLAVARRTNAVKCFLNGTRCTHTYRGRRWTCTLSTSSSRVHCRAGTRHVRYRLG
jgi:hypothetical protein